MKRLLTGAVALALVAGTSAMAQPSHDDRGDRRSDQSYSQSRGDGQGAEGYQRRGNHWARGQRLPQEYYRDRSHDVDYRSHHLRRPPAGYRWVRTDDNNYALIAVTSGLIASLIAGHR